MPRARLILLLGIIGSVLASGLWVHSLYRKSFLSILMPGGNRVATLGVVAGSIEFTWSSYHGHGRKRIQRYTFKLTEQTRGTVTGGIPDYRFGRFHHHKDLFRAAPKPHFRITMEVPIWALLGLAFVLLLPLHLHARRVTARSTARCPE